METNEKLMMLFRLMDKPEAMAEAQLQELLADEEVREAYELMVDCKKVYQMKTLRAITPLQHGRDAQRTGWVFYRKIAAIFIAAAFLGGLAWAFVPLLRTNQTTKPPQPTKVSAPSLTGRAGGGASSSISFSNLRLDSILTVVSTHYGKAVCFRNEEPRAMKLITTWNPADSLAAFIDHLNMFDCLHLTLKGDTIFVESTNEEDE